MADDPDTTPSGPGLKRSLSLNMLIFYGVGTILGMGIYVLIGKISGEAGMLTPFAFLVAAILAGFTGLSYGELAARIPKSAGEVNYVHTAFGSRPLAGFVGWLIVASALISTATMVNGYVGYMQLFVDWAPWVIITGFILILGGVAIWGIKEAAWFIIGVTIIEMVGILMVIIVGGDYLAEVPERFNEMLPAFTTADWSAIAGAAFLAFFAFIGFEDLVNLSEEAKNPTKDVPRSIVVSLIILSIVYMLVAIIANLAMTPAELAESKAPLADVVAKKGDIYPTIIGLISLVAIVNGVLVQMIMASRVLYGMGEDKLAPKFFNKVNRITRTPIAATVLVIAGILALALSFNLEGLAHSTSYVILTVFVFVNLSLIRIKQKDPKPEGIRRYPIWVPVLGLLFSLTVLVVEVVLAVATSLES